MRFAHIVILLIVFTSTSHAQSVTLSQLDTSVVADAEDFFTDVWANPADFASVCDLGTDVLYYYPESITDDVWTGTNPQKIGPVFGPVPIPTLGTPLVYREDCTTQGLHSPINADKYTRLSYKIKMSATDTYGILWSYDNYYALKGFYAWDWYQLPGLFFPFIPANEWDIKNLSLPELAPADEPWSGTITGLSLHPHNTMPVGNTTTLDWIRLIDPGTSPSIGFSWRASGSQTPQDSVSIFVDNDSSGHDGIAIERALDLNGSRNFLTGILAPGQYYFYAALETHDGLTPRYISFSDYVGPLSINGKPVLNFTAPSRMSGREYSRDERGDVWDMNESTDITNLLLPDGSEPSPLERGFHDYRFENGYFYATSDEDPVGPAITVDTHVHFAVPAHKPVRTSSYRYFCHRTQIDSSGMPRDGNLRLLNNHGWFARFMYLRQGVEESFGITGGHDIIERSATFPDFENGFTTYCFDLWDDSIFDTGPKWLENDYVDVIRYDPMESQYATHFSIDSAGLYAENRTSINEGRRTYEIQWIASDPEGDVLNISFYYDSDNEYYDGTLIGVLEDIAPGQYSYTWDATHVPEGTYYLYAEASDELNTSRYYSQVPIHVEAEAKEQTTTYVLWNGFLDMLNILEMVNKGDSPLNVDITLYSIAGSPVNEASFVIPGYGQQDLILNGLSGFQPNSYGIATLKYSGTDLDGRISFYRLENDLQNYQFAFSVPFTETLQGVTSVAFNTFQPSLNPKEFSNSVSQWLSIVNLDPNASKNFTVGRYDITGTAIAVTPLTIEPFSRVDIEGGHQNPGPSNVGLNVIYPDDPQSPYLAHLIRYGEKGSDYAFAFPLLPSSGSGDAQWVPISNGAGAANWLEVANAGGNSTALYVTLYDNSGNTVYGQDFSLAGFAQQHIYASGFLGEGESGAAKILTTSPEARVIAQSMFYFRDNGGSIEAMYGSQAKPVSTSTQSGSYNLFLGMYNWLRIFNTSSSPKDIDLSVYDNFGPISQHTVSLGGHSGTDLGIHDSNIYGTSGNTYGIVILDGLVRAELLRMKPTAWGGIDFAAPTEVR